MSLKASITRPAARIAKLQRPTATRAFDRKLISEEYDEAIIERVVTDQARRAEPVEVYSATCGMAGSCARCRCRTRSAKRSPSPILLGKHQEQG